MLGGGVDLDLVSLENVSFLLLGHGDFTETLALFGTESENASVLNSLDFI